MFVRVTDVLHGVDKSVNYGNRLLCGVEALARADRARCYPMLTLGGLGSVFSDMVFALQGLSTVLAECED